MKILFFAGALRKDSLNKKLVREALRLSGLSAQEAEFLDLKDFPMPVYDGDIEASSGIPEGTQKLGEKIRGADAIVLSTPEYNSSLPGALKNVIDWLSREKAMSLGGKHLLMLAASPGALGGIRVLWHGRQPFDALGMHVFPGNFSLAHAHEAFDALGTLKDAATQERLQKLLAQFVAHVRKA